MAVAAKSEFESSMTENQPLLDAITDILRCYSPYDLKKKWMNVSQVIYQPQVPAKKGFNFFNRICFSIAADG